jgi:hypothetical protein
VSEDNSGIIAKLQRQFSAGGLEVRSPNAQEQFLNINRDIGHMRVHLMANATINTQQVLSDPVDLEILDTIVLMLEHMVSESVKDQGQIRHFGELFKYLEQAGPHGWRVYMLLCTFFMQALYCQIFATVANASGLLPMRMEDINLYRQQLQLIMTLGPEQQKAMFAQLKDIGVWPGMVPLYAFQKQLDDYLQVILLDQARRYAKREQAERERDDATNT